MRASPVFLCRLLAGAFVVALASVNVHAQITQLRPSGNQGSEEQEPPSIPPILDISDDPDPFGGRYNFLPMNPDTRVWGALPETEPGRRARAGARAFSMFVVVDPASGAILGYEVGLPSQSRKVGETLYYGPDGFVRFRLGMQPPLRR